jgi:tetratricopeptide (TPR) repeat protein
VTRLALIAALCAYGVAAAAPTDPAPDPDKAKASAAYARGRAQYAATDYRAAAASFLEAYAADPDPGYLFNAGQAFRFAGDCAQAARAYRQFLGAVSSAPNLDKVRGYLDEMDACVRRQLPSPPPPPPTSPTSPAPPAPPEDDPGATRRHVGLALGGAGLAVVGAGVWFTHDVLYFEDRSHRCTAMAPCTAAQFAHWNDRGHTASNLAVTAYVAGGAALVGGAALYLLGRRRDAEPPIAVAPAPGGALVTAGFAF